MSSQEKSLKRFSLSFFTHLCRLFSESALGRKDTANGHILHFLPFSTQISTHFPLCFSLMFFPSSSFMHVMMYVPHKWHHFRNQFQTLNKLSVALCEEFISTEWYYSIETCRVSGRLLSPPHRVCYYMFVMIIIQTDMVKCCVSVPPCSPRPPRVIRVV